MKQRITTTDVSTIRPVFAQGFSENIKRYNQLKKLFEENGEYRIFAEPVTEGKPNILHWNTEYEGEIIAFSKLSPQEQGTAKGRLKFQVNNLYRSAIKYIKSTKGAGNLDLNNELFQVLDSCFEIADFKDIYVIKNPNGLTNFTIIRWGFISDDFRAQGGLVQSLIPMKVNVVQLKTLFQNNKTAAGTEITIEFAGNQMKAVSDSEGTIFIEDVPFFTKIHAYQLNKEAEKENVHDYICDDRMQYIFRIALPVRNMTFVLSDTEKQLLPNTELLFEYDGNTLKLKTDAQGRITLPDVSIGSTVKVSQIVKGKPIALADIECEKNKDTYNVTGKTPSADMNFKLVDAKQNIIPNAKVQFECNGKVFEKITDSYGYVLLEDVALNQSVTASQIIEGKAQNPQNYVCNENQSEYIIKGTALFADMNFILKDKNGNTMPNAELVFKVGENFITKKTDSNGMLRLSEIAINQKITVSQVIDGKQQNQQTFSCEADKDLYEILGLIPEIPKPPIPETFYNLELQFVNRKKEILEGVKVNYFLNNKSYATTADTQGKILLTNLKPNTKLKFSAQHENLKKQFDITTLSNNDFRQIIIGKRRFCVWWICLLLLLLLLAALWYLFRNQIFPPNPIIPVVDTIVHRDTVKIVDTVKIIDTTHVEPINPPVKPDPVIENGIRFKVIDIVTGKPIANANIEVKVGSSAAKKLTSDSKGVAEMSQVNETSVISTKVAAAGYKISLGKFNFVREKVIFMSSDGTVDVNEKEIPCGEVSRSGGYGVTLRTHNLNQKSGTIKLWYNMHKKQPDELIIYAGRFPEMTSQNIIWKTKGEVYGYGTHDINFKTSDNYITVKVVGRDIQTEWEYIVNCPK